MNELYNGQMSNDTTFNFEQIQQAYPSAMRFHFWTLARCRIIYHLLRQQGAVDVPVLEIGCGTGMVVRELNALGVTLDGVELADIPAHLMFSENVQVSADAFKIDGREKYETILLLDVLEHIEDRSLFLKNIFIKFPNAKNLIITVPARQELWSNYDDFYGHYLRYDPKTLRFEVSEAGLNLISSGYFFKLLYPAMMFTTKIIKKRSVKMPQEITYSRFFHRFLGWLFYVEFKLMPSSITGTSMFAIVRRG